MGRYFILSSLLCAMPGVAAAQVELTGRVVNETNAPVAGARVGIEDPRLFTTTDPTGAFRFTLPKPGEYRVTVEKEGHFTLKDKPVTLASGGNEVNLVLNRLREVVESVDVTAATSDVGLDTTASESTLTGNDILNIPYPTTNNLKNAMRVIPGVVQDPSGDLHVNGSSAEQVQYMLDGFNLSDPLLGGLNTRLSVEAVQTVEVVSGRMPAEYGKGSAGVISIRSKPGDDRWRYSASNFVPGIESQGGLHVGGWTPRFNLSGPLVRGRAWFSDSWDAQYDDLRIPELPKGQNSTTSWRLSNLLHNQFNLTPSNILYTSFLVNYWFAPRNGLGALDPVETTVNRRARQYFFNVRNQKYFGRGALLEVGAGLNRTFGREIPQGQGLYVYTPEGKHGNYFMDSLRRSARDQFIVNAFLPSFHAMGAHQFKSGIDLDRISYDQDIRRTGYEFLRSDGTPVRRTQFFGNGIVRRSNFESAAYLQDSWKARPDLLLEIGMRADWDEILRNWNPSPRFGFAWSPPRLGDNTRISGGYSTTYDATNLSYFARSEDQYSLTTYFRPNGVVDYGPSVSVFRAGPGGLRSPRYSNWTLTMDRRLPRNISLRAGYLRKYGSRGLTYYNSLQPGTPPPADAVAQFNTYYFDGIYYLGNRRRDSYDSVELTARQTFRGQYEWMASYTRSRARSNAVLDVGADTPLSVASNSGPMPWDSPSRFLSWGYLPTPLKNWAIAYLMEWRTGFPYSLVDQDGRVVGDVNSRRYPDFFELDLHFERRFSFRGYRWAFRFGANNLTGHENPNAVINTIGAANFGQYFGGNHRSTNFRIRWLGKI